MLCGAFFFHVGFLTVPFIQAASFFVPFFPSVLLRFWVGIVHYLRKGEFDVIWKPNIFFLFFFFLSNMPVGEAVDDEHVKRQTDDEERVGIVCMYVANGGGGVYGLAQFDVDVNVAIEIEISPPAVR
jgi:hypothetical protein